MKPDWIAVWMKDPAFGRAVARGLAESGNGFLLEVTETLQRETLQEGRYTVLLTDRKSELEGVENGKKAQFPAVVVADPVTCRVSQLCREILAAADRAHETHGARGGDLSSAEYREGKRGGRITGFLGRTGGCGTSAAVVTAGRMLAGAYGEKVLCFPLTGENGLRIYSAEEDLPAPSVRSAKELLYRKLHQLPCSVAAYAACDSYGMEQIPSVCGLAAEERIRLLLCLQQEYDRILVDLGCRSQWNRTESLQNEVQNGMKKEMKKEMNFCSHLVEIADCRDSRTALEEESEGDGRILIRNHGAASRIGSDGAVEIMEDPESFRSDPARKSISISMSKNYAIGIKNLVEILMK